MAIDQLSNGRDFLKWILIFGFSIITNQIVAQQTTVSIGADLSSSSGSVSYSVGQVFYSQTENDEHQILEGVQQPYEISITSVDVSEELDIEMIVFPNPTQGRVSIKSEHLNAEEWKFRLTDIRGQLLRSGSISLPQHIMEIHGLPASTYLLEVWNGSAHMKTFKIIKSDVQ